MRKTMGVLAALTAVGLAVAGCGGGPATRAAAAHVGTSSTASPTTAEPASTSTTVSAAAARQRYLQIVGPLNKAIDAFAAADSKLGNDPTTAQVAKIVAPLVTAEQAAQHQLLTAIWPAGADGDVRTLITDMGNTIGDLEALSAANVLDASSVIAKVAGDASAEGTAAGLVRKDLGLPQAS